MAPRQGNGALGESRIPFPPPAASFDRAGVFVSWPHPGMAEASAATRSTPTEILTHVAPASRAVSAKERPKGKSEANLLRDRRAVRRRSGRQAFGSAVGLASHLLVSLTHIAADEHLEHISENTLPGEL